MEYTELKYRVKNFNFDKCKRGSQGFKRLCVQFFGYKGHGKSSFINTCKYAWHDTAFRNYTNASGSYEDGTTDRRSYPLNETVTLVDNRGCATMSSYETGEIFAQLGNLLPLDKPVSWSKGFTLADKIVEGQTLVKPSDFIVPVFVYSAAQSMVLNDWKHVKELLLTARRLTGVFPFVVITHKQQGNLVDVMNMFRDIKTECFCCVENYTSDNHVKRRETHESVIQFFYNVIKAVEISMEHVRDPEKEMIERKILVLNYIHDRDVETYKNNVERQKMLETTRLQQALQLKKEEEARRRQREQEEHDEEMRRLREDFERQRLRDQMEHERRLREIALAKVKNKRK